ncbi:hypothetical protein BGX29_011463 [Mortierella sp. GBA35]|nr:hypothetical protein BGX29_011463 [Mortierella sp. GBA35]KAG0219634.1 hypothetical protein BGX33_001806 [Mortierella sp. NVP41]
MAMNPSLMSNASIQSPPSDLSGSILVDDGSPGAQENNPAGASGAVEDRVRNPQHMPHDAQYQGFHAPGDPSSSSLRVHRPPQEWSAPTQFLESQRQQSGHIISPRNPHSHSSGGGGGLDYLWGEERGKIE